MKRREFLQRSALASTLAIGITNIVRPNPKATHAEAPLAQAFEFDETSINELQEGMSSGRLTAVAITRKYLERIEDIDRRGPAINSVIEINPDAISIAETLDRERKEK